MDKPIILLAFANDQPEKEGYLRNLSLELNNIKYALERAEDHGLCELCLLPNATLDGVIHTFQRENFRDRIAIFHYGGHANSYDLMLEDQKGGLKEAKGEGLVPFLAQQKGLKLVFLNGCFSLKQAKALLEKGIPAVIGTVNAVNDQTATQLSTSFYEALAEGSTIDQAWKEATYKIQANHGVEEMRLYYRDSKSKTDRSLSWENENVSATRFPWEIYIRKGHDHIKDWNLAQAANNPYFGLPEIPRHYHYPAEPYQFLQRYQRNDTRIFFGRGNYIRDLYHRIISPHASPVILLHGQSGVGKSSFLEAGVFPRLETEYETIYIRRDANIGIVLQLVEALGVTDNQDFSQAWLNKEAETDKKGLIIILDQLEEVFTRPLPGLDNELTQLLDQLSRIFISAQESPKGKVILSYRKEYDSEIEKAIRSQNLPREKIFLDKLHHEEMIEIVHGLSSNQQLKNQYQLEVEDGLAELISRDLLSDRNSPIAPVLQIILTKMWKEESGKDRRNFSVSMYQKLRKKGILLDDFFHEQMAKVKAWEKETKLKVESTGLALDVLHYHTTDHNTAGSRSLTELRQHYQHQSDVIEQLVKKLQSLYLLGTNASNHSSLTHDTLAPIVKREIQQSDNPGQRALRILTSKMIEFEMEPEETFIDEEDLNLVEKGAGGMRMWTTKEVELIDKSRQRRARLQAERKRKRRIEIISEIVIVILMFTASFFWFKVSKEAKVNELVSEAYQLEENDALKAMQKLDEALSILPEHQIALQTRHDVYERNEFYSQIFSKGNEPVFGASFTTDNILTTCQGKNIWLWQRNGEVVDSVSISIQPKITVPSPDGQYLYIGGIGGLLRYNVTNQELRFLEENEREISVLTVSADGKIIISGDISGQITIRDENGDLLGQMSDHQMEITTIIFSPNQQQWVSTSIDGKVNRYDREGNNLASANTETQITAATFTPNGKFIITGLLNGQLQKLSLQGELLGTYNGHSQRVNAMQYSPDGKSLLTCSDESAIFLWNKTWKVVRTYRGHSGYVHQIDFAADGNSFVSASEDGTAKYWEVNSKEGKEGK